MGNLNLRLEKLSLILKNMKKCRFYLDKRRDSEVTFIPFSKWVLSGKHLLDFCELANNTLSGFFRSLVRLSRE
jgi:hypothetical protein